MKYFIDNMWAIVIIVTIFGLLTGKCDAQTDIKFLNEDNFKSHIAKDITVVEFWASWNKSNEFNILKLKECNIYRVDIGEQMKLQIKYKVEAIPTIIIFENGEEKERFEPNIMFQLEADRQSIQNSVDTLILNKFN
jgi:thiol-disulfide isomerase/thioredoxin